MKMCATSHSVYVFRIASCQRQTYNKTVNKMFVSVEALLTIAEGEAQSNFHFMFLVYYCNG